MSANVSFIPRPFRKVPHLAWRATLQLSLALALSVLSACTAFTVNGDGTVTDTTTGLVWDRCAYGLSGATCNTGTALLADWPTALTTAVTANAASYKGLTGWRLPNRNELESLVKIDASQPAIDSTAFPNTPWNCNVVCGAFWSSTSYASYPLFAWLINFSEGNTNAVNPTNANYVRLVHSGQSSAAFDLLGSAPTLSVVGASGSTLSATSASSTGY